MGWLSLKKQVGKTCLKICQCFMREDMYDYSRGVEQFCWDSEVGQFLLKTVIIFWCNSFSVLSK